MPTLRDNLIKEEVIVKDVQPVKQVTEVEATNVELGFDLEKARYASTNDPDPYLAKYVISKYKDKNVAWADKEQVTQSFRGWKILKWEQSNDTLVEVKSMDEATKRTSTVLAWRDIRIKQANDAQWREKQKSFNTKVARDGTTAIANEFNQQLAGMSRGLLQAKPLSDGPGD